MYRILIVEDDTGIAGAIQEQLEKISVAVETLQLWSERMLATGAIDPQQYRAYKEKRQADT